MTLTHLLNVYAALDRANAITQSSARAVVARRSEQRATQDALHVAEHYALERVRNGAAPIFAPPVQR